MLKASLRSRLTLLCCLCFAFTKAQVANYISNGSFENLYSCTWPNDLAKAKSWMGTDSACYSGVVMSSCPSYDLVPSNGFTFQYARTGKSYGLCTFYLLGPNGGRGYLKNRMKKKLDAGKKYCVKFYVNLTTNSTHGIDAIGIYFGDNTIDTITHCSNPPITYLTPQVQNPAHNIITDTLNWVLVTGTFVASGTEKFALIGNFKADSAIDTVMTNPTYLPAIGTDFCVDDVSCIDIDLPAFAGNDTTSVGSNSVYIGRPRDVGIDEDCMWYKLPMVITPTTPAIDTAAGLWVCPPVTSTYVVRQEICGNVKWDTVVVWKGTVGIDSQSTVSRQVSFYPNPATTILNFTGTDAKEGEIFGLTFVCSTGQFIYRSEITFKNRKADLDVSNLAAGIYCITMQDKYGIKTNNRLVITK